MTSSVSKIPKDHTSDLIVNLPYRAASGAVHLMGNFAPAERTCGESAGREHGSGCGAGGEVPGSHFHRSKFVEEDGNMVNKNALQLSSCGV